ncbi:MAG: hypothetical protein CSA62_00295 [Planctomycetota bacterium]|nr:MAG: hypothetical protein CSA62_00295 [Planctomycetota bacterium]
MKRISAGWQDDQATLVFDDPKRVVTLAELNQLFLGSRFRVLDLRRVQAKATGASDPGDKTPR